MPETNNPLHDTLSELYLTQWLSDFNEGRVQEARKILLMLGEKRFGPPCNAARRVIAGADLAELHLLIDKLHESESWNEVFA